MGQGRHPHRRLPRAGQQVSYGLAENVRTCPRTEGAAEILLPGDPERREAARRQTQGIPLDDGTWGQLVKKAERLQVALPESCDSARQR